MPLEILNPFAGSLIYAFQELNWYKKKYGSRPKSNKVEDIIEDGEE